MATSGKWFQGPAEVFRRKAGNINVSTFWSFLQVLGWNSIFSHLDQKNEKLEKKYAWLVMAGNARLENVPLPLNWLEFQIMS